MNVETKKVTQRRIPVRRFPWRKENSFQLLIDAEEFMPAMLRVINEAQNYILLEMYLIESSNVTTEYISALLIAADRGVQLYLLLDDFGVRGLNKSDRDRLQHKNIQIVYYNPLRWFRIKRYLNRDHRKLLLADNKIAITGSAGIISSNDPSNNNADCWRETMVEIKGQVVSDWKILFEGLWNRSCPKHLRLLCEHHLEDSYSMQGRVIFSRPMRPNTINRNAIRRGLLAQKTLWIATAYFNPPRKLLRMLRKKARHGVDVRLLLPGPITDHPSVRFYGHRFYTRLLRAGVRIFEYQPRFMHSKLMLSDDWCSIGSCNFDRWNIPRNLEANQEIADSYFAAEVKTAFEHDFEQCIEIKYSDWVGRPTLQRLKEWFWSQVTKWFDKD